VSWEADRAEIDLEGIDGIGGRDWWINSIRNVLESLFDVPLVPPLFEALISPRNR